MRTEISIHMHMHDLIMGSCSKCKRFSSGQQQSATLSQREEQSRAAVHDDMRRNTAEPRSTECDWLEECLLRQCVLSSSPKTLHAATLGAWISSR
mmetsp:Transcript_20264/g.64748  ORF Transcript_20264/g.64748 Transcript_20264/m.64748 type:complete len:95 (-) Transcript_20264:2643-2927(-)